MSVKDRGRKRVRNALSVREASRKKNSSELTARNRSRMKHSGALNVKEDVRTNAAKIYPLSVKTQGAFFSPKTQNSFRNLQQ